MRRLARSEVPQEVRVTLDGVERELRLVDPLGEARAHGRAHELRTAGIAAVGLHDEDVAAPTHAPRHVDDTDADVATLRAQLGNLPRMRQVRRDAVRAHEASHEGVHGRVLLLETEHQCRAVEQMTQWPLARELHDDAHTVVDETHRQHRPTEAHRSEPLVNTPVRVVGAGNHENPTTQRAQNARTQFRVELMTSLPEAGTVDVQKEHTLHLHPENLFEVVHGTVNRNIQLALVRALLRLHCRLLKTRGK